MALHHPTEDTIITIVMTPTNHLMEHTNLIMAMALTKNHPMDTILTTVMTPTNQHPTDPMVTTRTNHHLTDTILISHHTMNMKNLMST